jgi:hypothetical protein
MRGLLNILPGLLHDRIDCLLLSVGYWKTGTLRLKIGTLHQELGTLILELWMRALHRWATHECGSKELTRL